jgi:Fe-S cluster assembly ATPase SufC
MSSIPVKTSSRLSNLQRKEGGMLVIFGGLPGTGKSTLALRLSGQVGAVYLRIDTIWRSSRANRLSPSEKKGIGWPMPWLTTIFALVTL